MSRCFSWVIMYLSPPSTSQSFSRAVHLKPHRRGMGAIGLPGDFFFQSSFARAAFIKLNSSCSKNESLSQFFHRLDSVNQIRGSCQLADGNCEITRYTTCCNASKGIWYCTTYAHRRIAAMDMRLEPLEGKELSCFPLIHGKVVRILNGN